MGPGFERIYNGYGRILVWFGLAAGACTFFMMWLVVANSLMRKVFNYPLEGTLEVTEALLPTLVFLSLALTQFKKGHIRVTLMIRSLPFRLQHGLGVAAMVIGFCFFLWVAAASWGFAMESFSIRENEAGVISFPVYPIKFIVFIGVSMLSLQFLLDAVRETLNFNQEIDPEQSIVASTEI